jgi:hypothetical protein
VTTHAAIVKQFLRRQGSIESLAQKYGYSNWQIEEIIRKSMAGGE